MTVDPEPDLKLELQPRTLFLVGFTLELGLILPAGFIGYWTSGTTAFPFRVAFDLDGILWGVGATVPMIALAFFLTTPFGQKIPAFRRIYERVRDLLGDPLSKLSGEEIVSLAGAAGVGEEVLFRGVLLAVTGPYGLWISSLVFALLHALTPAYFVLASLMGLYLGWVQVNSQNLLAPILVHWIYDAVALHLLKRRILAEDRTRPAGRGAE